jgi:hypothetical protein
MAVSSDLFLSILAMDAYNRGYNQRLVLGSSQQIGNATIGLDESGDAGSRSPD